MSNQICPKCKSTNISVADKISMLGNPLLTQSMLGWECLDCGYIGKNFFIVTEKKARKQSK